MSIEFITISCEVIVTIDRAWAYWTDPAHIVHWNHASEEWSCPKAESDLVEGGKYKFRMEAKDGSMGFDFSGTFIKIDAPNFLSYDLDDGRMVEVSFQDNGTNTSVVEKFQPDPSHDIALQKAGWQAILNNFKIYAEGKKDEL